MSADIGTVQFASGTRLTGDGTVIAGELSGGVSYKFNDTMELFSDVRYLVADELDFGRTGATAGIRGGKGEADALSMNFGIRIGF